MVFLFLLLWEVFGIIGVRGIANVYFIWCLDINWLQFKANPMQQGFFIPSECSGSRQKTASCATFWYFLKEIAMEFHRKLVEAILTYLLRSTLIIPNASHYFFQQFKHGDFDLIIIKESGRPPKTTEDAELQELLGDDSTQAQQIR